MKCRRCFNGRTVSFNPSNYDAEKFAKELSGVRRAVIVCLKVIAVFGKQDDFPTLEERG
jgi:hypothetical protein